MRHAQPGFRRLHRTDARRGINGYQHAGIQGPPPRGGDFSHPLRISDLFSVCQYQKDLLPAIFEGLQQHRDCGDLPPRTYIRLRRHQLKFHIEGRFVGQYDRHRKLRRVVFLFRDTEEEISRKFILDTALSQTKIFPWFFDPDSNLLTIDRRWFAYLELPNDGDTISAETFFSLVHPDDRKALSQAFANRLDMAKHIDYVSWDSYPAWNKEEEICTAYDTAMQHDLMRSMKQKPFLLMESCPSSPNWQTVSKLKKPGLLQSASLQAIAHGSDSVQYFQIRQSRGGFEKFHGAVIDHYGGSDTRVFNEVTETGASLIELKQVIGSKVDSSAAIIYDMENRWAMEDAKGPRNEGLFYHESVLKSYQTLRKAALNIDIINMEQSLDSYKLVVAPMLYIFRAGIEIKLRTFVENGGILIMTYWSGIVNETDLCYLEGTPHGLLDVLGLRSKEIDGLYEWEENLLIPVTENSLQLNTSYKCKNLCDLIQLDGATPLMNYGKDFYQGTPALTVNQYGKGYAYYICADAEELFYHDFYAKILAKHHIHSILNTIPDGIEVTSRTDDEYEYIFIQNFSYRNIDIVLPKKGDIIYGNKNGNIRQYETIVFRKKLF